jgi:hypothetical protein
MIRRKDWKWFRVDELFMEESARRVAAYLQEHGLLAVYEQHSRDIDEDPYVEHTWRVLVSYRHNERDLCHRLMTALRNGHVNINDYEGEYRVLADAYEETKLI